jgi:hypothetical protein
MNIKVTATVGDISKSTDVTFDNEEIDEAEKVDTVIAVLNCIYGEQDR